MMTYYLIKAQFICKSYRKGPAPAGDLAKSIRKMITEGTVKNEVIGRLKEYEAEFRQL